MPSAFFADGPLAGKILPVDLLADVLLMDIRHDPGKDFIRQVMGQGEMFKPTACYKVNITTHDRTMGSYVLVADMENVND